MALGIPKVVQSLFVQSTDASRVRDNIVTALQPVLDFLGQYFIAGNDGSLTVQRPISAPLGINTGALVGTQGTINGPLTAAMATINGQFFVNGTAYFKAPSTNGVVIQPGAAGVAFYVTNVAGTAANFLVYDTGAVVSNGSFTGPSFVSSAGFKQTVKMGQYYHTSYPGGQKNTVEPLYNIANGAMNSKVARHIAPRAGSITAIMVDNETPVNATCDVGVAINGTQIVYPRLMAANAGKGTFTYAKGAVPFNAGDTITCLCGFGAASITVAITVSFEIEVGA